MRTWNIEVNGRTVAVKALKAQAESLQSEIRKVAQVPQTVKELNGIVGENEYATTMFSLFGPSGVPIADPEGYEADRETFYASVPDFVYQNGIAAIVAAARALCAKHVPVSDKRKTREQDLTQKAEWAQAEKERREQRDQSTEEFVTKFGNGEKVTVPSGQRAIVARLCYDASDMMTDYWAPHMPLGPALLVGVTSSKARTEKAAKNAIARYPELANLTWSWHTENYSMGHGNYLQAEDGFFDLTYNGQTRRVGWEIQWGHDRHGEYWAFEGYDASPMPVPRRSADGIIAQRNEAKNGVEIIFPDKPSQDIRDELKAHGFRWSFKQGLWYKRYNPQAWEFAQTLAG